MIRAFRGRCPTVDPSAFVDESAQVIGEVDIGTDSSIWMQVVLRGDVNRITIGRRTNVQDGAIVHVMQGADPTRIGDDVTIGHGAIVHGCTVGHRVLIGMGAIVLTGAVIGDDTIIAAGALVTERMIVPPRSLVMGSPGAVRRALSDEEVGSILQSAANYVRYKKDYR